MNARQKENVMGDENRDARALDGCIGSRMWKITVGCSVGDAIYSHNSSVTRGSFFYRRHSNVKRGTRISQTWRRHKLRSASLDRGFVKNQRASVVVIECAEAWDPGVSRRFFFYRFVLKDVG